MEEVDQVVTRLPPPSYEFATTLVNESGGGLCEPGQVGAYAGAARCRVHFVNVLLGPPSAHRPGRRQT